MKSPPGLAEGWVSNLDVDFTCFKVPAAPCPLPAHSLPAPCLLPAFSVPAACSLLVPCLLPACSLPTAFSLPVPCLLLACCVPSPCPLPVPCPFSAFSLPALCPLPTFSLPVPCPPSSQQQAGQRQFPPGTGGCQTPHPGCRGGFVSPCCREDDVSELQTTGKGKVLASGAFLLVPLLSCYSFVRQLSVSRAVNCSGQGLHLEIMSWE